MLAAAFCGSACLFLLELFAGKFLLPRFGGAPAVWVSCLAFFQVVLVGAYFFSHRLSRAACPQRQVLCLGIVFFLAAAASVAIARAPQSLAVADGLACVVAVPIVLACTVGPAFFTLATLAPLLGHWHAVGTRSHGSTGSRDAVGTGSEAYGLYAAGNAGSFTALFAYPLVVEGVAGLSLQADILATLFVVVGALVLVSGWRLVRTAPAASSAIVPPAVPIDRILWMRWMLLAAIPASWLASITTYATVEVAPLPLLWIIPLALYLASFVFVFASGGRRLRRFEPVLGTLAILTVTCLLGGNIREPAWLVLVAHGGVFFVICIALHGMLVDERPPPEQLTSFYLAMAIGGAVGGLFNAVVAPLLFDAHYEFPLMVAATAGVLPSVWRPWPWRMRLVSSLFAIAVIAVVGIEMPWLPPGPLAWRVAMVFAAAVAVGVLRGWERPCGVAILLLSAFWLTEKERRVTHRTRTFFGVVRVVESDNGPSRELVHGTIRHGVQLVSTDAERRRTPLAYYHPAGPLGSIFATMQERNAIKRVGVAGLGIGTVAAYARPGEEFVFFEIDPVIVGIATNVDWFTYLADCRGTSQVIVDDARLALGREPDGVFDLLVIDAFTGDSVPTHLLTREALALYGRKVTRDGVVAIHISNRYLDFAPIIESLAAEAEWMALDGVDRDVPEDLARLSSRWMVLTRSLETVKAIYGNPTSPRWHWRPAVGNGAERVWTDDRASVTDALFRRRSENGVSE